MSKSPTPETESQFLKLTQLGGALCLGVMFGFIASIESVNPSVSFSLNWKVFVGVFGGGGLVWWLLGMVFASAAAEDAGQAGGRKPVFWMLFFCFLCGGVTLGGFAFAMKETPGNRVRDVMIGSAVAFWVIGFCCMMVWRLIQFLEEDSARGEEQFRRDQAAALDAERKT
jgi:hypothetical protein